MQQNGIMYNKTAGAYYTAVLPCIFKVFEGFDTSNSELVAGAGITWNQIFRDIVRFSNFLFQEHASRNMRENTLE